MGSTNACNLVRNEGMEMHPAQSIPEPTRQLPHTDKPNWFRRFQQKFRASIRHVDDSVGSSLFGRLFRLRGCGHVSTLAVFDPNPDSPSSLGLANAVLVFVEQRD